MTWQRSAWCSSWGEAVIIAALLLRTAVGAELVEPESVAGLNVRKEDGNVVLSWPSDPRESFVVLWRPAISVKARWIELTNQLHASPLTNETVFLDQAAFLRGPAMLTNANLAAFYRVFLIPDFWFDLNGVELRGGPNCGEDFLPFYNGSKETDTIFEPHVSLLVDNEKFHTEESTVDFGTEESVERTNFGAREKPRWAYSRGLWFQHDTLPNGEHTLQLSTLLTLNLIAGDATQYLTLTNQPVRVRINNEISYPEWQPLIQGDTYTFVARSATQRANWRIEVYNLRGQLLASRTGRTTTGEIRWTWDLRDKQGQLHDGFDTEQGFRPTLTTWPMAEPMKGGQALLATRSERIRQNWWTDRLGRDFVRKPPTDEESHRRFIYMEPHPLETNALTRPLELFHCDSQP